MLPDLSGLEVCKILKKDNGTAGNDWGWGAEFSGFSTGSGISGSSGSDLGLDGFSTGQDVCIVITQNLIKEGCYIRIVGIVNFVSY